MAFSKFISKADFVALTADEQTAYTTELTAFIAQCKALGKISVSAPITGINPILSEMERNLPQS